MSPHTDYKSNRDDNVMISGEVLPGVSNYFELHYRYAMTLFTEAASSENGPLERDGTWV